MAFANIGRGLAVLATLGLVMAGTMAQAERKPRGSSPADPQTILKWHAGKTWDWPKGGSFWGGGGDFQAVWTNDEKKSVSYADGKWYVTTRGTICYKAVWKWQGQSPDEPGKVEKVCWQHVTDKNGTLWQRNHEKNDWYRLNPDKVTPGNQIKAAYRKHRKMVGH